MRHKTLFLIFCLFSIQIGQLVAQNVAPEMPYSLSSECPLFIAQRQIPISANNTLDADSLRAHDLANPSEENRVGVVYETEINPTSHGVWDTLPNGDNIWRLTIAASGAQGLILYFDSISFAPNARLHVYDSNGLIKGPYHAGNLNESNRYAIRFMGSQLTIELYEPEMNSPSALHLNRINYLYGLADMPGEACYRDITCEPQYANQSSAVAVVLPSTGGSGTGFLVNNACNDGKLLFLTAFHNLDSDNDCTLSGEEEDALSTYLFLFQFQKAACGDTLFAPQTIELSGATLVKECSDADMALLKLSGPMPDGFDPFLLGWDVFDDNATGDASVCIHHPGGRPKKISTDIQAGGLSQVTVSGSEGECPAMVGTELWLTRYANDQRIKEGASGGPLILSFEKRAIGVLNGVTGYTEACIVSYADSQTVGFFGKLSTAFDNCAFDLELSPPEAGQGGSTQLEGMFFSERNNTTCSATNGGPDCVNPYWATCFWDSYTYPVRHIEGITYNAGTQIYYASQGIITGYDDEGQGVVVPAGANISYRAHDFIELGDGFTVEEGGQFESDVGYCCTGGVNLSDQRLGLMDLYSRPLNVFESTGHFKFSEQKSALFPNPTTGHITLQAPDAVATVQVLELTGRVLQTLAANGSTTVSIDLSPYQPGTYLLRAVYLNGRAEVWRVVRQ